MVDLAEMFGRDKTPHMVPQSSDSPFVGSLQVIDWILKALYRFKHLTLEIVRSFTHYNQRLHGYSHESRLATNISTRLVEEDQSAVATDFNPIGTAHSSI